MGQMKRLKVDESRKGPEKDQKVAVRVKPG
jgi:hypothetical protein